ncbi:MAG: hypothetical protein WBB27_06355 [Maribacter sp.]
MKVVKLILVILVALILKACGTNSQDTKDSDSSFSLFGSSEKTFEFKDPKSGLVASTTKYPSDWKLVTKAEYKNDPIIPAFRYQIQGQDGLQAFNAPMKMYFSSMNPQLDQMMLNSGKNVRNPMTTQQLIQSEVAPKLHAKGFVYNTNKIFPELEQKARKQASKNVTSAFELEVNGTVWKNNDGQKALVILSYLKIPQQSSTVWMYTTDVLISNQDQFDNNVEAFVKANLKNVPTPEWENYMANLKSERNQQHQRTMAQMDQRARIANQEHQMRMANKQASFTAHQQKMQGIWAAQDASHASFMNNTFGSGSTSSGYSSGGGQQSFLNMINEEETVYNPGDGNSYQIQSGAKETWMDSDGNPIYSNDVFYNPNNDNSLNNMEWSKVWEDY